MRHKQRKKKLRSDAIWLTIGLLLLAVALFLTAYNIWDGNRADRAAQTIIEQLDQIIPSPVVNPEIIPNREMPTVEIDGNRYIGELTIPSLELTLPVMAEWDYDKLKISPCRFSGSYYKDDLVIAGHNYARHFSPLKWLPVGSTILFTNVEGEEFHYTVTWVETLQPENVEEMVSKENGDWALTLFTCNTGGQTRYTIRCIRDNEDVSFH